MGQDSENSRPIWDPGWLSSFWIVVDCLVGSWLDLVLDVPPTRTCVLYISWKHRSRVENFGSEFWHVWPPALSCWKHIPSMSRKSTYHPCRVLIISFLILISSVSFVQFGFLEIQPGMQLHWRRYLIAFDACDEIPTGDSDGAKFAHLPRSSRHGGIWSSPLWIHGW